MDKQVPTSPITPDLLRNVEDSSHGTSPASATTLDTAPPMSRQSHLLLSVFAPHAMLRTSREVEGACAANGLTLKALLSPFCAVSSHISIKDPNGMVHQVPNFQIKLDDSILSEDVTSHSERSHAHALTLRRDKTAAEELPSATSTLLHEQR